LTLTTNRHIPPYCPDFPDPLTYQHTPVFWRKNAVEFSQHERNNESKHDEKDNIEQNDIEKTRKIIIDHANIFSQNIKNTETSSSPDPILKQKKMITKEAEGSLEIRDPIQ